jgi:CDP-2,3-bis-(O-geranylgeranyl)-sn-glycerol synthase
VQQLDPIACAVFLVSAFVLAGFAQTAWFTARISMRLAIPLDAGSTLRGRRVFGEHKTLRGFVVMVPATAAAFALLATATADPEAAGLWPLTPLQYAGLGSWAAFGFMAGELPNSFVKRQLGIAPGAAAESKTGRLLQLAADRLDSAAGMLAATSLVVSIPALTWLIVLMVGPALHWSFSVLMFALGLKARPA